MQRNIGDDDIDAASDRLANLSVCEPERSPLKGIPSDSPRIKATRSPYSACSEGKPKLSSGSESGTEEKDIKEAQARFNKLVKKAKHLAQEGKVQQALELNREALKIHYHEKLARRIAKMEEYLRNYSERGEEEDEEDETEGGMVQLGSGSGFYLHKDLNAKLYSHQKQGVLWMWELHRKKKGGILGDDMGLGKTIQVIAFLSGLIDMDQVRTVMIVLPVSVMVNWEKEFNKWAPGIPVYSFHGTSKRERERSLDRVQRRGGVLLTTYGMVLTSWEQLSQKDGREYVWDYVILDEGHKIKNPSKTTRAIHGVCAHHRIILTGTPIQNNLKELWTLFDYVHQGSLLGTLRTFKMEFENPIIRARERDATAGEKHLGLEMAESLKKIIDPYFLRRTKAEVKEAENKGENAKHAHQKSIKMPTMTFKNDFVVWLYLSDTQLSIYQDFLQLDSVKELLTSSKSPLVALTVLKKICDHPRLLSLRACHQLGLHGYSMEKDELELPSSLESAVTKIESLDESVLVREAGKMGVLISLVDRLRQEGHRTLVFSQSRKILDILQKVLRKNGHRVMRLDGTIKSVTERDELVQKFQNNTSYSVFLLTTQVGGVGLTLTAADRVIIYDPSWNPATDAQAVDRAFRIGQTKNVVIYRLITCGTVEEKIYRRQIFKDSITRQATGNAKDPYRYFTKQELRELFQLEEPRFSNTQRQLEELHGLDRRRDPELDEHITFLHTLDIFGISDHDLMFSQESREAEEEMVPSQNMPIVQPQHEDYIKHRVQKAKDIIERESSVPGTMEQRMRSGCPTASVYAGLNPVKLLNSQPADPNRVTMNRPGGGVTVFQPKPSDTSRHMLNRPTAKAPQMIMVYPPKPIQKQTKQLDSSNSSVGSLTSDPIDLTLDDNLGIKAKKAPSSSNRSALSDEEGCAKVEDSTEEPVELPQIRKKDKADSQRSPAEQQDDVKSQTSATKEASPRSEGEAPTNPGCLTSLSTPKRPEQRPQLAHCPTPSAGPPRVVEEELIISPNSYTPLMMTRQKRRRLTSSPIDDLRRSFTESVFVANTPDLPSKKPFPIQANTPSTPTESEGEVESETPNEIASFLAEDDLVEIQESLLEETGDTPPATEQDLENSAVAVSEGAEHDNASDEDSEPIQAVKTKRRRSVCRRVAVIESSEDEIEDDENKENLHPSFSKTTHHSEEEQDDDKENDNCSNGDDDQPEEEDEDRSGESPEATEEESDLDNAEAADEHAEEDVRVYDESMCEDKGDDNTEQEENQEMEEGEGDEEEENEEVEEEEELDMELLKLLLKEGKIFYRQKQYPEALEKCQAALAMLYDPQLQAMVDKIQSKIDQGL